MKKYKAKKQGDAGFSLVELLIMLSMVAILSAVAIPTLSTVNRDMQLAADVRNISSTLTQARLKATSLMNPYRISFNLDRNQWSLEKYDSLSDSYDLQQAMNGLSRGLSGSGINFKESSSESQPGTFPSSSSTAITFNSRGIPVDGSNIPTSNNIIYISNADVDYAITVTLTGKVQVWKKGEAQWDTL